MGTDFFAADDLEATARPTGFVSRASKMSGKRLRALVTVGSWREAKTPLAPLAATITHVDKPVDVAPEAMQQRMTTTAMAFLPDMLRQALAKVQALDPRCADGLLTGWTHVDLADSPGFALADRFHARFAGSGGSAPPAGAKRPAVWDDHTRVFDHFALTPGNIPDQK
ncbi:MAG TPA: hypothetical protein VLK82_14015 [Candidatus Tectomicrobia bacterium]|nr:hypothetical protein [Candidatus Tectomicrobia bacterium]